MMKVLKEFIIDFNHKNQRHQRSIVFLKYYIRPRKKTKHNVGTQKRKRHYGNCGSSR